MFSLYMGGIGKGKKRNRRDQARLEEAIELEEAEEGSGSQRRGGKNMMMYCLESNFSGFLKELSCPGDDRKASGARGRDD